MAVELGILGPENTFTDLAAQKYAQEAHVSPQRAFFSTIEGIVVKVEKGALKHGIVPLKNTIAGQVRETQDALKKHKVEIVTTFDLEILHALVGLPGTKKEDITTIISHPQPLRQCKKFLQKNFPKAEQVGTSSTMAAFEIIRKSEDHTAAAIIPLQSADKLDCTILEQDIGDEPDNYTTFALIQAASDKG